MGAFPRIRRRRLTIAAPVATLALYGLLAIPEHVPEAPPGPEPEAFAWNQNARWDALEESFRAARAAGCTQLSGSIADRFELGERLLTRVRSEPLQPMAAALDTVEDNIFRLGPLIAACQEHLPSYVALVTQTRSAVKRRSEHWDVSTRTAKDRLYRLLWGGRMALEEVMLQSTPDSVPALVLADGEPSQTPFTRILGATIHSGDLLVSRGGAPTSALIAVGNDYPGHFSHVAIVHVDEHTNLASVIQSSQNGLHASTLDDYLEDIKLRVMILRPRADLPEVIVDPMLPHKAAQFALNRALTDHVPYDFAIDHHDASKMYCSEVPATAYAAVGVSLWMSMSRMSEPRTRAWLAALGVTRFETQEPSDLEYDPQLRVVAEWRDPNTLYLDHVDNVTIEAMLSSPGDGEPLTTAWYLLPGVRAIKGYSMLLNAIGKVGPVPEGLSATLATRVLAFNRRHRAIREQVLLEGEVFMRTHGYRPPEWELLAFAKRASAD